MGIRGRGWKCVELAWEFGYSWWKCEKCGNQGGDERNQVGNMAVKMTKNNNGNDKFKEWEEVKVTEKSIFAKA